MSHSQHSRILAILAEDVDENEPKVVQVDDPASPCRLPTSPSLRRGKHDKKMQNETNSSRPWPIHNQSCDKELQQ
jgi:hypothetical protein